MPLHTARVLALAVVSSTFALAAPLAAHADVKTDTSCNPNTYTTKYRIRSATRAPAITHIKTVGISPGGTRTVTKTVAFQQKVSAAVTYSSKATVEAGLPGKILGKAGAELSMTLAANGSHTSTGTSQVTDTVSNGTSHNVQYVFYRGVTRARGAFRKYYCQHYYVDGQNYGYYAVTYAPGRWRSYAIPGEGAVRCGAGTKGLGALARAALRLGCPA